MNAEVVRKQLVHQPMPSVVCVGKRVIDCAEREREGESSHGDIIEVACIVAMLRNRFVHVGVS